MNRSEQTKVKVLNEVAQGALTAREGLTCWASQSATRDDCLQPIEGRGLLPLSMATEGVDQLTPRTQVFAYKSSS